MTKHIVLTGATSGIGRALAIQAHQLGYKLSLCGRSQAKMDQTLAMLAELELNMENVFSDCFCVSDSQSIKAFGAKAKQANGDIDILINCAGLNNVRTLGYQTEIEALDWMMKINCYAPIELIKSVLPDMLAAKQGCIVNVLSTVCLFANAGISSYTASKMALDGYTKVMRKEHRADNIKFLSVYPGGVDTEFRAAERPQYLTADAVAKAILNQIDTDANTHIHELVIRPPAEENFC